GAQDCPLGVFLLGPVALHDRRLELREDLPSVALGEVAPGVLVELHPECDLAIPVDPLPGAIRVRLSGVLAAHVHVDDPGAADATAWWPVDDAAPPSPS